MKQDDDNEIMEYALHYIQRRWHVFPLPYQEKTPFKGSRGFKDATLNPEQIKKWFRGDEKKNLAIRTGSISNIVVVDIDKNDRADGFYSIEDLGSLPDTYQVKTKQGVQLYFRYPDNGYVIGSTTALGSAGGIDIRGDDGYVVAPPSVHPSGQEYTIEKPLPLADLPQSIIDLYNNRNTGKNSTKKRVKKKTETHSGGGFVIMPNDLLGEMAKKKLTGPQHSIFMFMRGRCGLKDKGKYSASTTFECPWTWIETDLNYPAKTINSAIPALIQKGFIALVRKGESKNGKKLQALYRLRDRDDDN